MDQPEKRPQGIQLNKPPRVSDTEILLPSLRLYVALQQFTSKAARRLILRSGGV